MCAHPPGVWHPKLCAGAYDVTHSVICNAASIQCAAERPGLVAPDRIEGFYDLMARVSSQNGLSLKKREMSVVWDHY